MTDEELQLIEEAVMFFYEDFNYDEYVTAAWKAWKKAKEILKMSKWEDSCAGCKWENDSWAEECDMCSRIRTDNYEKEADCAPRN